MKNCKTCSNAIFESRWGEIKCKVLQHKIYKPDSVTDCANYKKGKPAISAKKEDDIDDQI